MTTLSKISNIEINNNLIELTESDKKISKSAPTSEFQKMSDIIEKLSIQMQESASIVFTSSKIKNFHDYINQQTRSSTGFDTVSFPRIREFVAEMEAKLIQDISSEHLNPNQKIVEIGAGQLDPYGHSYLMQRLPEELMDVVEPTEINQVLINQSDEKLKRADATELENLYPSQSVDRFIGSAMLDTLSEGDLISTLKKMHSVLKDNGRILHISTLEPYRNTLLSAYANEDTICFPLANGQERLEGLQMISKKELLEFLDSNKELSEKEIDFLRWFANLSSGVRELILNTMNLSNLPEDMSAGLSLSAWIEKINIKGLTILKNKDFFENKIKRTMKKTGFKIIECGYREGTQIIDRPRDFPPRLETFNYFSLEHGNFSRGELGVLAVNKIYQHVKMHVIIAEVENKSEQDSV